MPHVRRIAWAGVAGLMLLAAACTSSGEGVTVEVEMSDWEMSVAPESVPSGTITFEASNAGPTTHEFEIFSGAEQVDPAALPVSDNVADTAGLTLVDEVEDVTAGATASLTATLEPGTYAIVCNLPKHYAQGMVATLVVE